MTWQRVVDKFHWLAEPFADDTLRNEIVSAIERLDDIETTELTALLGAVSPTPKRARSRGRL
jgi:2-methylcitrate dehydratase